MAVERALLAAERGWWDGAWSGWYARANAGGRYLRAAAMAASAFRRHVDGCRAYTSCGVAWTSSDIGVWGFAGGGIWGRESMCAMAVERALHMEDRVCWDGGGMSGVGVGG
jgi:hypothetical protein